LLKHSRWFFGLATAPNPTQRPLRIRTGHAIVLPLDRARRPLRGCRSSVGGVRPVFAGELAPQHRRRGWYPGSRYVCSNRLNSADRADPYPDGDRDRYSAVTQLPAALCDERRQWIHHIPGR
jgi:hypothetical protein